jgi:hypothetical protein
MQSEDGFSQSPLLTQFCDIISMGSVSSSMELLWWEKIRIRIKISVTVCDNEVRCSMKMKQRLEI